MLSLKKLISVLFRNVWIKPIHNWNYCFTICRLHLTTSTESIYEDYIKHQQIVLCGPWTILNQDIIVFIHRVPFLVVTLGWFLFLDLYALTKQALTLPSPQLVPSTAPSILEWHVLPTVHHNVLHTFWKRINKRSRHKINMFSARNSSGLELSSIFKLLY